MAAPGDAAVTDNIRNRMVELLPRLRRFAYALTGDLDRADDLVQEACARALANIGSWDTGSRLDSWMYRITQNIWFDTLRANKVRGEAAEVGEAHEVIGIDGRDVVESHLTLQVVSKAIGGLPADQQLVLLHVCIDGLTYNETATALGIPVGTVMSRLARARRSLHAATEGTGISVPQSEFSGGTDHE